MAQTFPACDCLPTFSPSRFGFVVGEGFRSDADGSTFLKLLSGTSLAAAAVGVLLLAAIRAAGVVSSGDRHRLAVLFRPGLYVTAVILAALVITHAAIFAAFSRPASSPRARTLQRRR